MKIRPVLLALLISVAIPAAANAITVKAVQSPSGVETWLSEEHSVPMIAVSIAFPAGAAYDPTDKPGLATFVSSLMDEGAGDLTSEAFKQALEARAIRISASADRDYLTISMTTLKENADEAFRLLGLVLTRPRFDQEAVERMRVALLSSLKQEDEQPSEVASKSWFATYFGTHPYAHSDSGTTSGVQSITINDIKAFAADHLVRDRVKMSVAGDITDADLRRHVQQLFTSIPTKTVAAVPRAADARPSTNTIPRNEPAPVAMFGFAGPMRLDADFIPTFVANYILGGGGFSSRLMDEVRDKRGLTYGISTYLADYKRSALIVGSVQSDKSKIQTALDVTKSELRALRARRRHRAGIGRRQDLSHRLLSARAGFQREDRAHAQRLSAPGAHARLCREAQRTDPGGHAPASQRDGEEVVRSLQARGGHRRHARRRTPPTRSRATP